MNRENAFRILALGLATVAASATAKCQVTSPTQTSGNPETLDPDTSSVVRAPQVTFNLPQITCQGGQLSIRAKSSSMRAILQTLRVCLNVPIEAPETLSYEPVFLELGPGPVHSILTDFLSLTGLNFVVLSSQSVPSTILKIELSTGGSEADASAAGPIQATDSMSPARRAWLASRNLGRGMPPGQVESASASGESSTDPQDADGFASKKDGTGSTASTDQAANIAGMTPVGPTAPTAALPDASQVSSTDNPLQHQITDMQRLFEERKKLNQNSNEPKAGAAAPPVAADSNPTPPSQ